MGGGAVHLAFDDFRIDLHATIIDHNVVKNPGFVGTLVHLHHGIGMYRGLHELDGPEGNGEFLKIEFAEGTVVYVPVARIDLVQRYVGTGRTPRLSKVGGTEWTSRKQKVSEAVEELAEDLLESAP